MLYSGKHTESNITAVNSVSFLLRGNPPEPHPRHTESKEIPRQTKKHGVGGGAEMRSISETKADEPSRGRRIFQQKNICDRAETTERERNPDAFGRGGVDATA